MKKTVTKRLLTILMAFVMICSVCNVPERNIEAASDSDKYEDESDYNISSILSQYQFFLSGNVTFDNSGHTVGGVIVGGEMDMSNTFGDAAIAPSYVKTWKHGDFGNAWHGKYPDKCNIVYYDTGYNGPDSSVWIQNSDYINMEAAFQSIKEQSNALAKQNTATTETTINCSGTEDIYVTIDYAAFKNGVNIKVDDVNWFNKHILCISVTGVNKQDIEFDGYSKVCLNGKGISNQLKDMAGADKEYNSQLNVSGMNLLWNFPDASKKITTRGLGGHLVAPNAEVFFESGNYEGGVIAASMSGGAEGHFYPMSKTLRTDTTGGSEPKPDIKTADGTFSKKTTTGSEELPGAELALHYKGDGSLENVKRTSGPDITINSKSNTISWVSGNEPLKLSKLPAGVYTMVETGAPNGYKYTDSIIFKVDENGKIYKGTEDSTTGEITYESEEATIIEMRDEAKVGKLQLKGTKVVTGEGENPNPNEEYEFVIKDDKGNVISTGKSVGAGEITFTEIKYDLKDVDKTYTYTVSEVIPADVTAGMVYDKTVITLTVSIQDIKLKKDSSGKMVPVDDLTVTYEVKGGKEITFTNRYYEPGVATFSKKAATGDDELPGAELSLTYTGEEDLENVKSTNDVTFDISTDNKTITWKSGEKPLELSGLPDGTYVLHEEGAPAGYQYADDIYFQVKEGKIYKGTKNGNTVTYADKATAEPIEMIDNAKAGSVTLKGTKTVTGKDAPSETYNFVVKEGKTEVATGSVTGSGEIIFTEIKYAPADIGEHTYVVTEQKPQKTTAGMTYDAASFEVTVTVSDDGKESLSVSVDYDGKAIIFNNIYEKPDTPTTEEPSTTEPTTTEPTTEEPATQNPPVVTPPTGNLEIVVRDEKTKEPVPNATVEIVYPDGHKEEAKTDEHGQITKNDTPIGEYTITVTKVPEGYDVSTGQSAKALVETNKTTRHIAEIVTKTTVTTDSTAKTGDSFEVVVPIALLIYSAAAMIILGCGKKKH